MEGDSALVRPVGVAELCLDWRYSFFYPTTTVRQPQGIPSRKRAPRKRGCLQEQSAIKRTKSNRIRLSTINETLPRQVIRSTYIVIRSRRRRRARHIETSAIRPYSRSKVVNELPTGIPKGPSGG